MITSLYHSLSGYRWKCKALRLPEHRCSSRAFVIWVDWASYTVAMKILGQLQWLSRIYHRKLARRIGLALLIAYSALSIAITVLTMVIPARFARFLDAHFPGKLAARAQFVNSHSGMLLFFYST